MKFNYRFIENICFTLLVLILVFPVGIAIAVGNFLAFLRESFIEVKDVWEGHRDSYL